MFNLASDLEYVWVNLGRTKDLLVILLDNIFDNRDIPEYLQRYGSLVEATFDILCEQEKKVRIISDDLYDIDRQLKAMKNQ